MAEKTNRLMDWMQVLTIVAAAAGSTYAFFLIVREDMKVLKEDIVHMDNRHREDVVRMDAKWEHLFERLLVKEQGK